MTLRDLVATAKVLATVLVLVSLGSCGIVQFVDNRTFNYTFSLERESGKKHCAVFERKAHIGHYEPLPPALDDSLLNNPEALTELALAHAEKLKTYLDNERRYLAEDVRRHLETCK